MEGVLKYGGGPTEFTGQSNFNGSASNVLSFCCTPIELLANDGSDTVVATASGFFWKRNERAYLVTNWHVVSGRNVFTKKLSKNGFIPKRLRFYGFRIELDGEMFRYAREPVDFGFRDDCDKDLNSPPVVNDDEVDLYAIQIPNDYVFGIDSSGSGSKFSDRLSCYLNDHKYRKIVTNSSDECFIVGYPLQNHEGLRFPLWKRGSIASETPLGVDGRPIFLIDASATPGMSGAPVFRKSTTGCQFDPQINAVREAAYFDFIGVYAGHLQDRKMESVNLGYAWYQSLIDDVVDYCTRKSPMVPIAPNVMKAWSISM